MRAALAWCLCSVILASCSGDDKARVDACPLAGEKRRCTNEEVTLVGEQECLESGAWSECDFFDTHPCASPPACAPCPGETMARLAMCVDGQPRCPSCSGDKNDAGGMDSGVSGMGAAGMGGAGMGGAGDMDGGGDADMHDAAGGAGGGGAAGIDGSVEDGSVNDSGVDAGHDAATDAEADASEQDASEQDAGFEQDASVI